MQVRNIPIDGTGRETTRPGQPGFPLAVYHSVMSRNVLGFTPWHWNEELQFCLVTRGHIRFFVNEAQYLLSPGDGIFVNSGFLHQAKPEDDPDSSYICLDAGHALFSGFAGSVFERRYFLPYRSHPALEAQALWADVPWQRSILDAVRQVYRLSEEMPFGYEYEVQALLGRMWITLVEHLAASGGAMPRSGQKDNAAAQRILSYLEQHYEERITMAEIAKAVSFSPEECCRLFKRVTGETIFSYLRSYRLSRALALLREDTLSISQIAYETGFCGTSYFIEVFKAYFGTTPLQYHRNTVNARGAE